MSLAACAVPEAARRLAADAQAVAESSQRQNESSVGAAGAVEAVLCAIALVDGLTPGSPGTRALDPALQMNYQLRGAPATLRHTLTNSFGFGGSNCSLVFGKLNA